MFFSVYVRLGYLSGFWTLQKQMVCIFILDTIQDFLIAQRIQT